MSSSVDSTVSNIDSMFFPLPTYRTPVDQSIPQPPSFDLEDVISPSLGTSSSSAADTSQHVDSLTTLAYVTDGILTNLLVVGGLVANVLSLVVLSRPSMRSSTNCYLSALAVWDSVVLGCSALLIGLPGLPAALSDSYVNSGPLAYVVSYFYPIALIAQTVTIWLTVSFAVERYIGVQYPLRAASLCTMQRARLVIAVVCVVSTLYNLPRWFEYRPLEITQLELVQPPTSSSSEPATNNNNNLTLTGRLKIVPAPTDLCTDPVYLRLYYSWLYLPVMCIVPLVALSAINASLVLAVRRSRADRRRMNVRQSRENNVTLMLVSVVAVFIVCQVPALAYNVAYAVDSEHTQSALGYRALSHVRNLLVNVNSAVNFLLYCAFGQKFRRVFLLTFCRSKRCRDVMMHTTQTAGGAGGGGSGVCGPGGLCGGLEGDDAGSPSQSGGSMHNGRHGRWVVDDHTGGRGAGGAGDSRRTRGAKTPCRAALHIVEWRNDSGRHHRDCVLNNGVFISTSRGNHK